ncbi:hypothetical protein RHMOL_Rhmol13G0126600 [Rhododendron molle]|uniref:Uncharacterized protein n=1 Tax=Rhododendron molle TaxID=49168 RepID=A0ACC0L7B7_RHOML|nr:hypothetical protein RHMOL_Rhmol13G0126600 [Rhododendron molle]
MGTGHVVPSNISAVQTCFGRSRYVWVIFKCKIIKISLQAQTDLDCPKHVWTAEMRAQYPMAGARLALKNFSMVGGLKERDSGIGIL